MLLVTYAWPLLPGSPRHRSPTPLQFFPCQRLDQTHRHWSLLPHFHSRSLVHQLWICPGFSLDYSCIFVMASQPPFTSIPSSTSAPSSPAVDVSAHRSCQRCARRMSSFKYDKCTICNQCRDVNCAVDVRCSECSSWTADTMQEYLKPHKSVIQ